MCRFESLLPLFANLIESVSVWDYDQSTSDKTPLTHYYGIPNMNAETGPELITFAANEIYEMYISDV